MEIPKTVKSARGIVLQYMKNGVFLSDGPAIYVDDLCDCFDTYKSGSLKDHCKSYFDDQASQVKDDRSTNPGETPKALLDVINGMIELRAQLSRAIDRQTEESLAELRTAYLVDPQAMVTATIEGIRKNTFITD